MFIVRTLGLFILTAVAEIVGCYLPYLWLKKNGSVWLLVPALLRLAGFAWLLTLHPTGASRTYAAYGGVYVTTALHRLASTLATTFVGQLIAGGSLSLTVTVKLHVAVLPAASVTRNTLVVTPTGKADPLANPPVCVVSDPAQLSVPTGAV